MRSRTAIVAALASGLLPAACASAQWQPSQPVEIVIGFSPGGGSDRTARKIDRIFHERKLVPGSVVVNKPGASGTIGWTYLNQHAGNGHYISIATLTLLSNHIAGRSPFNYTDFTPLARLFSEGAVFAVRSESTIRDWRDLAARLGKDPASVTLGSANREGAAPLTFAAAMKEIGADPRKMKLVTFNSAGDAVTAALGGHIEVAVVTSEGVKQLLAAGKVRVLAISTARRVAGGPFAAVPTLSEQGINVVSGGWRAVLGPKGLSENQIAIWDATLGKLTATPEWKQDLEASDATNEYLNSADTGRFLAQQFRQVRELMSGLGLAKQ